MFRASPIENVFVNFVSKDMMTDGGVTKAFNMLNPLMPRYVRRKEPKLGTAVRYNSENRKMVVYNLVVSTSYHKEPLLGDILSALRDARRLMMEYGDMNIVFTEQNPMVDWEITEPLIKKVFNNVNAKVKIYSKG